MKKRGIIKVAVNAAVTVATGILCLTLRHDMIHVILLLCGVFLVLSGIMEFALNREYVIGTVKIILGFLAGSMAWNPVSVTVVLYLLALTMTVYGLLGVLQIIVNRVAKIRPTFGDVARPFIHLSLGILLFLNHIRTADWFFLSCGVLLILRGIMSLTALTEQD